MRHDCLLRAEDLGPYLLGGLEQQDRDRVAQLLLECPTCAAEVERLAPVVAALGRVPVGTTAPPVVRLAPAGLDRVLASMAKERAGRRRRVLTRVGLAAAGVAVVSAAAAGLLGRAGDDGQEVALAGGGGAAGTAVVADRGWGTSVSLEVRGLRPGRTYGAWLADERGDRTSAGTFRATADGTARLDLAASLRLGRARVVGVTLLGGPDVLRAVVAS